VDEYKQVKALARENLRDHMTDIELILTMLGEAITTVAASTNLGAAVCVNSERSVAGDLFACCTPSIRADRLYDQQLVQLRREGAIDG